ncbi:MAG: DMT family transporter [Sphingomonadaceae bacterium]|nr:DMT family transporter [Sphingomonadaceae bacterium]
MSRTDAPALPRTSPILIAAGGVALLCVMDAVMKHVVGSFHPVSAMAGRSAMMLILAVPLWFAAGRPTLSRDVLTAHVVRGTIMAFSGASFFWALTVLPLAEAVTLSFVAPLIIPLIAWALLKERPRLTSVIAGAIGFAGVLLTTQGAPAGSDTPERTLGIVMMLLAALAWATSLVLLRGRASRDGPAIIVLMGALVPALLLAPVAVAIGDRPSAAALGWMLLGGALTVAGIWLMTRAYARAQAQVLAPIEFTALAWAALLGWLFFAELPRFEVWAGAAVIIGACLFAAWDERRGRPIPPL